MAEYDKATATERQKVRTQELTNRLETGMKELYDSDKYRDYLKSMSHFHQYSSKNIMLIHQQLPTATMIASFKLWEEKFNRHVKKGETGLYIYAPIIDKNPEKKLMEKLDPETGAPLLDKDGKVIMEEMTALTNEIKFKLVPVFDQSQTYGDPLPELVENITGNVAHYEAFLETLKFVSPLPIVFEPMDEHQDGYCRYGEQIGIRDGMSETQTVCTVIHEIAHARLHDNESSESTPKTVKEVESESVSYVVCQRYGIETSPNSFGYIAEFGSRDMTELKSSLDTIRKEANSLISAIDDRYEIACKERGIDLTVIELGEEITSTMSVNENTNTIEHQNYIKLTELFPQIASGEYKYLRLESEIMEPLSLEWINDNKLSMMHTYTMNGDLMYDPMIVLEMNRETQTATAVEFEQSMPPIYQRIDADGIGYSVDGNGRE